MIKKKKFIPAFERSTIQYFDEIANSKPLSREEESKLWHEYKYNNNIEARNKIVSANLKFVTNVAKNYIGKGLSYSDLISEGNMGLIRALDKFDANKGYKVISYSVWWIRQSILEALEKRNNTFSEDLPMDYEKQPTDEDNINEYEFSFNEKYIDEESSELVDYFQNKELISKLFAVISNRERRIIEEYYGLNEEKPKTLDEIGKGMGLTKERIRQIMEQAKKKMRCEAMNYLD